MPALTYYTPQPCPRCKRIVAVTIMSLSATCECGMYLADVIGGGWFESREAYREAIRKGEARMAKTKEQAIANPEGGDRWRKGDRTILVHFSHERNVYFNEIIDGRSMLGGVRMELEVFQSAVQGDGIEFVSEESNA